MDLTYALFFGTGWTSAPVLVTILTLCFGLADLVTLMVVFSVPTRFAALPAFGLSFPKFIILLD